MQNGLDYIQNPNTFLFRDVTNPTGNFLVQHGIQPLRTFFIETPWPVMLVGLVADRIPAQRPTPRGDCRR